MISQNRQKTVQGRNVTPNFMRFKRKNSAKKPSTSQEQKEDNRTSQRSSSKASRCSFQVYQKKMLTFSKLKNTLSIKRRNIQENTLDPGKRKITNHVQITTRRTSSNQRKLSESENQNLAYGSNHNNQMLDKKKSMGSGKILKAASRDKNSAPKRSQQSLDKEQQRAKLYNAQLLNTLMNHQHVPNYMSKLKLKKNENIQRKKTTKKKFLNCNIQFKGQDQLKNYEIFGELGKGAYGVVRMGIDKRNGEKVAIKLYEKKRLDQANKIKNLQRQIDILAMLNHNVIAKLIDTIETSTQIYIIMQYGGANSLYNYLLSKPQHRLQERQAKSFLKTIAQTLRYLHEKNIVHRDIKAENILLNRNKQLKLIDFGFSLYSKPPSTIDTFCGTPTYMAPQIVSKRDHVPIYTDMWSLGILFYVMLQGNYPFRAKNENQLFEKIRRGNFQYIHDDITVQSKHLIESLLQVNPLQRLTVQELLSKQYSQWHQLSSLNEQI